MQCRFGPKSIIRQLGLIGGSPGTVKQPKSYLLYHRLFVTQLKSLGLPLDSFLCFVCNIFFALHDSMSCFMQALVRRDYYTLGVFVAPGIMVLELN